MQTKALLPQGASASHQWGSTMRQALTSLAWPLILLFWPHGPFSTLIPDRDFKTPSLLYFPDSHAFSSYLLPLGKNPTHHHGPTELCGLQSHPLPSIPALTSVFSMVLHREAAIKSHQLNFSSLELGLNLRLLICGTREFFVVGVCPSVLCIGRM